jgi:hypothetical protein
MQLKEPPHYTVQEEINTKTDRLAGNVHINLPNEYNAQQDCLHFPEQNIYLVLDGKKATSKNTRNVAYSIHKPELKQYLCEKE